MSTVSIISMIMKCYKKLDIPNHSLISDQMYDFVVNKTTILQKNIFWTYVNAHQVFDQIPDLKTISDSLKIDVDAIAVIWAPPGLEGAIHIDYGRDMRILWPIKNCEGSYTRFFKVDPSHVKVARLPNNEPYYEITQPEPYEVLDELELTQPVVFDSSIAHGIYTNPGCTEPRLTFTIRSKKLLSHLML